MMSSIDQTMPDSAIIEEPSAISIASASSSSTPMQQRARSIEREVRPQKETKTNKKRFKCQLCNADFASKVFLSKHSITCFPVNTRECRVCGEGFTTWKALKEHVAASHKVQLIFIFNLLINGDAIKTVDAE